MFQEKGTLPSYTSGMDRQAKRDCVTCYTKFRNKQPLIERLAFEQSCKTVSGSNAQWKCIQKRITVTLSLTLVNQC